jgi:hypothetical protein
MRCAGRDRELTGTCARAVHRDGENAIGGGDHLRLSKRREAEHCNRKNDAKQKPHVSPLESG